MFDFGESSGAKKGMGVGRMHAFVAKSKAFPSANSAASCTVARFLGKNEHDYR